MSECTVQLWYNKRRPKKNGTVSLYLQLIVNGEHDEVPLKSLSWPLRKIDWDKKELKPRAADDEELVTYNALIERERAKYWKVIMAFLKREISFGIADVFREVNLYKNGHLICEYMDYAIKYRLKSNKSNERIKQSTSKPHRTSLAWLKIYLNNQDMEIAAIDSEWLARYADYLRGHMSENTVWVRIKDVKTYLSFAAKNKIQVNDDYKLFVIKPEETEPTWLEEHELNALLALYHDPTLQDFHKRNLRAFLFACFTGLRISDLSRWSKEWIQGNEIVFIPTKRRWTKREPKPIRIPIIPLAWDFINDLEKDTLEIPDDQVYNRQIKSLTSFAKPKINKVLTSHVARHTFATWLAIDGVPVLVIGKLLGHKSAVSTNIYLHIAEVYKAVEMMKMQRRFGKNRPGEDQPPAGSS